MVYFDANSFLNHSRFIPNSSPTIQIIYNTSISAPLQISRSALAARWFKLIEIRSLDSFQLSSPVWISSGSCSTYVICYWIYWDHLSPSPLPPPPKKISLSIRFEFGTWFILIDVSRLIIIWLFLLLSSLFHSRSDLRSVFASVCLEINQFELNINCLVITY